MAQALAQPIGVLLPDMGLETHLLHPLHHLLQSLPRFRQPAHEPRYRSLPVLDRHLETPEPLYCLRPLNLRRCLQRYPQLSLDPT